MLSYRSLVKTTFQRKLNYSFVRNASVVPGRHARPIDADSQIKIDSGKQLSELCHILKVEPVEHYNVCNLGIQLFGETPIKPASKLTLDQAAYICKLHKKIPIYRRMPYTILEISSEVSEVATKSIPTFDKVELRELGITEGEFTRNPAIVICGHVDHGKTSILDRIRNTDVQSGEAGGITQHVSAFTVDEEIVFLDTPGHAAFSDMRQRGVFNADIAVLVIAADDGIMQQTEECLNFIKAKNIPFVVAINKVDKKNANPDAIIESLFLDWEVETEELGGDVPVIRTSIKSGKGIQDLLVKIKELRKKHTGLQTSKKSKTEGFVVENHRVDKQGIAATCFIQAGEVRQGSTVKCGHSLCKIKSIIMEDGTSLTKADTLKPGQAARLTGWNYEPSLAHPVLEVKSQTEMKEVLKLGKIFEAKKSEKIGDSSLRDVIEAQKEIYLNNILTKKQPADFQDKPESAQKTWFQEWRRRIKRRRSYYQKCREIEMLVEDKLEEMIELQKKEIFSFGLVTDVSGTSEAILEVFKTYKLEKPKLNLVFNNISNITETELRDLAPCNDPCLYTFHYEPNAEIKAFCEQNGIKLHSHKVIYRMFDEIMEHLQTRMPTKYQKVEIGRALIKEVYNRQGQPPALGVNIISGKMSKSAGYRIMCEDDYEVIHREDTIAGLRFEKTEKDEITGGPCGIQPLAGKSKSVIKNFKMKIEPGQIFVCEEYQYVQEKLTWNPTGSY
jgi:translation initiation factor IF-2